MQIITPESGRVTTITTSARLLPGVHFAPLGIAIEADGVTLDGTGCTLVGQGEHSGIRLNGRRGVVVSGCRLRDYQHGIHAVDCDELALRDNQIRGTAEVPANTIFLDIWRPAHEAYGAGMLLHRVGRSTIERNDLQHQQNGMLCYGCDQLSVRENNASYCSGFGFHLHATSDSRFEHNYADYCCRYEPRGERAGHVGADAAGFVIVYNSCRNTFKGNFARLGGDGFFLAGLTPQFEKAGCNDNLFEANDASLSPNIAFEATFSSGNVFRNNRADYSNFGFWLGYSWDNLLEGNRLLMNRQAGIAVEHGVNMTVRQNEFTGNGHGVLLWTRPHKDFAERFPALASCSDWRIEHNSFASNGIGIRIAADMDHGIRPVDPMPADEAVCRPARHQILHNRFVSNRIAIELVRAALTAISFNSFSASVEAHIRDSDSVDTTRLGNLGLGGAYAP